MLVEMFLFYSNNKTIWWLLKKSIKNGKQFCLIDLANTNYMKYFILFVSSFLAQFIHRITQFNKFYHGCAFYVKIAIVLSKISKIFLYTQGGLADFRHFSCLDISVNICICSANTVYIIYLCMYLRIHFCSYI